MPSLRLAVAMIALLVSVVPTMAQNWAAYGQPGSCGSYRNSSGHLVPSPCGDWRQQPQPSAATARCRDGTYSFSEHPFARGTCNYHGGVDSYIR
jgi:hypothetical protein